jgi:hypothetical protein
MLPSPARAISINAASSASIFSASAIRRNCSTICFTPIVLSSNTCERDWMVAGTLSISVVAIMKTMCGGGSSIDLSSASNDCAESRCTSSMMKILNLLRTGNMPSPSMITARTLSTWVLVAASISMTSMSRPSAISTHASHVPHGSAVGPVSQFSARARMRAVVVLPTPRGPEKTNDCAMRFAPIALRSVCVTPRCPMTSSNRWGRHLRART